MCGGVSYITVLFCLLIGDGILSSQNFAEADMNWIAECVNIVGQGALLMGALLLHKSGLSKLSLEKK